MPTVTVPEGDAQAWVDGEHLTTVLAHLIRNAQDAVEKGGSVSIEVSIEGDTSCVAVTLYTQHEVLGIYGHSE